jgi:hypothetical protein
MVPGESDFPKDMARMQRLFEVVRHQYDLFFAGGAKDPPTAEHRELDRLARAYAAVGLSKIAQQFLFQSFMNKYILHNEQWNKWLRAREDGLVKDPRLAGSISRAKRDLQDLELARPQSDSRKAPPSAASRPAAPRPAPADPLRGLYEEFIKARIDAGELPQTDFKAFEAHVRKQKEAIASKYGAKDVVFTVSSKEGKVTLKAKIVK